MRLEPESIYALRRTGVELLEAVTVADIKMLSLLGSAAPGAWIVKISVNMRKTIL
jgi:hypothetical protein